jgi:hypothetical protein
MLNEEQKKALFERIRLDTIKGIFDEHQKLSYRLWGWLRNNYRRVAGSSTTSKAALGANLGLTGVAAAVQQIPILGGVITKLGGEVVAAVQAKDLYKRACSSDDPDDKVKLTGEYMVVGGAQAVSDAIRKVNDAAADLKKKKVTNCKEYVEFVNALYYYNYRLQRLMMYNGQLKMYAIAVEAKLLESHKKWEEAEKALEREGVKFWDDWSWHSQHCTSECCTFPWDSLEISGPTNVKLPAGLQGVKLNPIQKPAPPPLPPRPFKKI